MEAACSVKPVQDLVAQVFSSGKLGNFKRSLSGRPARSKTLGVKFPASSMSWEWAEVVAWTRRCRNMALDFQRPSSMMRAADKLQLASSSWALARALAV